MVRFGRLAIVLAATTALTAIAGTAAAHPLGNFTTNTHAAITVRPDRIDVAYVLDLAEVPALQARQRIDTDGDDTTSPAETSAEEAGGCARLAAGLVLTVDGTRRDLVVEEATLTFPPGQAGLVTLRLECELEAPASIGAPSAVILEDGNHPERVGWREIVATGEHVTLVHADVPAASSSDALRRYPADRAPPGVRRADLVARPGGDATAGIVAAGPLARPADAAAARLGALVGTRQVTPALVVTVLLAALLLGAAHALAPGHGKAVMAAYVVGERGSLRHVLGIGATVALTHTLGVLLLAAAITAAPWVVPERLYPWLGGASGTLLVALGGALIRRGVRARRAREHGDGHAHDHHPHHHAVRRRDLVTLGLAGGLVPSPSAVLVLLGALTLGRAWLGMSLVVAYGAGLACALLAAGLLLVRGRARMEGWLSRPRVASVARFAPLVTGVLVVVGGVVVVARAALAV